MIRVQSLSKSYRSPKGGTAVAVLSDITLDVHDGEFVTLLGPSGCGKTTLLRCIAGLTGWDDGAIFIGGQPIDGPGPDRAVVFQNFALLPWMNVIDNVAFGLEARGMSGQERRKIARELMCTVGLEGFEERWPHELSGGMQQRAGLARALAVKPAILLMDEPFGALDEQTRRLLQEELLAIWRDSRMTVIFVTHSMEEAVRLGDRVVLMSNRPATIDQIVKVEVPRPRTDDVMLTEEFQATSLALWHRLRRMHEKVETP